jgi:hypothetical protein
VQSAMQPTSTPTKPPPTTSTRADPQCHQGCCTFTSQGWPGMTGEEWDMETSSQDGLTRDFTTPYYTFQQVHQPTWSVTLS